MKKELERIRLLVASFQQCVTKYPNSVNYQKTLIKLQQQEVNLINKIGRNK